MKNTDNSGKIQTFNGTKVNAEDIRESSAYSTVFDALFLLVLISLSGIILMPSLQADEQYAAASYVTSSELDTYLLESLLSCKLEDFEYEISPLSVVNVSVPKNSIVADPAHTLFGKELKHRTFADLTAEYLAISLRLQGKGSSVPPSILFLKVIPTRLPKP